MTVKEATNPGTVPQTMEAVVRREYGPVDNVHIETIDTPAPGPGQVLIEVHAAGIDRGQWHLMAGLPFLMRLAGFGLTRPKNPVLGLDVSGHIVAVGDDVDGFGEGDEVFGIANGSFADYAIADAAKLAAKPETISHEQAAVAAVSGITALQALTEVGELKAGQSVLVVGASGGVGSYAVQMAKALGARVTGVASGAKGDLVRSIGADDFIDYTSTDYLDGSKTYDMIIDIGGRNPLRRLRRALAEKGTLVIVGGEGGGRWTGGIGRQIRALMMSPFLSQRLTMFISSESHELIERLGDFLQSGRVVPVVGRTYSFDQVPQAIADLDAGRARGKSVLTVR
jgi:NADPH:quinone reductase-like Zn-dependent oxidoreductase